MYWSNKSSCKTFHTYPDKIMMIFTWLFINAMTSTYQYFLPYCYQDLFPDTEDGIFKWWLCIHSVTLPRKWKKKCTQLHKDFWTKLWNISNKTVSGAHCIWASKHFPLVYFFLYLFPFFVDVSYWILMGWNITQMLIILLHPFIFVFYNAGSSDVNRKKRQLIIHIWSIFWTCSANIWFFFWLAFSISAWIINNKLP